MDIKVLFGNKIKILRKKANLSQEKLALATNIDRTYISDIEKGERNVSIETIEKLASVLGLDVYNYYKND
jgi:transcriptional regulator with XRE-family HTH domain